MVWRYIILCPWLLIYDFSVLSTEYLVGIGKFDLDSYYECVSVNKQQYMNAILVKSLANCFFLQQQATLQARHSNIPSWLSVLPLARNFDLSAQEFRDGLTL